MTEKPQRGRIERWYKAPSEKGLGYHIIGNFLDHPDQPGAGWRTTYVVAHDEETGMIETKNSRYQLVGKEYGR